MTAVSHVLHMQRAGTPPANAQHSYTRPVQVQVSLPSANVSSANVQQANARHHHAQLHSNESAEQHSAAAVLARAQHAQSHSFNSNADTTPSAAHAATQLNDKVAVKGSVPAFAAVQTPNSCEPAQFMSALSGLYGSTTPEQKRQREDKQRQYAHELDEQVAAAAVAEVAYTRHAQRGAAITCIHYSSTVTANMQALTFVSASKKFRSAF